MKNLKYLREKHKPVEKTTKKRLIEKLGLKIGWVESFEKEISV